MNKTIWKFPFEVKDVFSLDVPEQSELLKIDVQHGQPCMWFMVDPDAPKTKCTFHCRGSGHDCGDVGMYLDSFQLHGGELVFHVFARKLT